MAGLHSPLTGKYQRRKTAGPSVAVDSLHAAVYMYKICIYYIYIYVYVYIYIHAHMQHRDPGTSQTE